MATLIKGIEGDKIFSLPSLEKTIKEQYGIDLTTKRPLDVHELSSRIGKKPSLLISAMLLNQPKCSLFGVNCLVEVIAGIAENQPITVASLDYGPNQTRPFNFTLDTAGFLKEEFECFNLALGSKCEAQASFCFAPEYSISKRALRDQTNINGTFDLDLKIDLGIAIFSSPKDQNEDLPKRKPDFIPVGSVVVEFDGATHLADEQVRNDKLRDSMVQSNGCTVFRIQVPYQQRGIGSTVLNRDNLASLLEGQIKDIKNHFQSRLFATVNASYLLNPLLKDECHGLTPSGTIGTGEQPTPNDY